MPDQQMSEEGLNMLANFEGTVTHVYTDVAGYETVGVGHKLTEQEKANGTFAHGITKDEARELLRRDVGYAERAVNTLVKVPLSQPQFDVLVSFVFNLGMASLMHSTLLQRLNAGEYDAVPGELEKWHRRRNPMTGTMVDDAGLLARRRAEGKVWQDGYGGKAALTDATSHQFGTIDLIEDHGPAGLDDTPPTDRNT